MIEVVQRSLFDIAESIRARLKRTAEDIIAIGNDLIEAKALVKDGEWGDWLQSQFEMSQRTARLWMQVAERFGNTQTAIIATTPTVLYELVNSDETIIEKVESGQIPATLPAIREAEYFNLVSSPTLPEREAALAGYRGYDKWREAQKWEEKRHEVTDTPVKSPVLTALQSSESNEWFTPREYVDAARELMGGIDIDPASNEYANRIVQATRYFTKHENGLMQSWHGRVWLNPPYGFDAGISNQETWTHQLIERYTAGLVTEAVLLVNANTEAKWFQPLYDYLICLTNHRIRFYNLKGDASQPTQGNALVYFGKQRARFIELFSKFGTVIERARINEC